jgi:hypothetical protein
MDIVSMVSSILAMQAANTQTQIGAAVMKSNLDAEKSAVQTLLGAGQPSLVGAGIGGNLDISA